MKISTAILDLDATALAEMLRNGTWTSEEVVTTYINHIKKVNPPINALVEDRFEKAIAEAKQFDETKSMGGRITGKLAGVPISVKEAFHVTNMKTTGCLEHRQDLISRDDAKAITKLRKEGAIILGKTNTPALCYCQETDNKLYGRTNNPWDINRTAGGSSGGEGALLAAGGAAVGIASDIGGSIRFPSHFNGVVGFKPGMHQVTVEGHYPEPTHPLQQRMLGIGPMGKSVRDMELMNRILTGTNPKPVFLNEYKVELLVEQTTYPLAKSTKNIMRGIEDFLIQLIQTKRGVPPLFDESAQLWQEIMSIDGSAAVEREAFSNDRSPLIRSYLKERLTNRTKMHPYLSWAILGSKMFKPSKKRAREINDIILRGDEWLNDYLNNRLLIFPVYHTAAPIHGQVFKEIFSIRKTFLDYMPYIAYANVWGLPSLTLPVGKDENDMPVSIQIISSIGNEAAIFRLGSIIEKKFHGYRRCKRLD
ncbi:amidase [Oceanobacillus indicireducens]|uniref:Amidase n=1 Tax=Oceanobacillus indicireducens TaxID=1004261 RepID=A0A918CXZ7_9BACI|nr:amidase [Oceanobacillus indicireducens]GGN48458.1 amidase [Oceanobacillus indicireducens]